MRFLAKSKETTVGVPTAAVGTKPAATGLSQDGRPPLLAYYGESFCNPLVFMWKSHHGGRGNASITLPVWGLRVRDDPRSRRPPSGRGPCGGRHADWYP